MSLSSARPIASAALACVLAMLPVHLLGATAVLVRDDLHFDQVHLGVCVAAFFAAFGLASLPAGVIAQSYDPRRGMLVGVGLSGASLLGIATLVSSWQTMAVALAVGGVGNALAQTCGNLALVSGSAGGGQSFAFGLKQSAIPTSSLLAGAAAPAIGIAFGWRWAFVAALVIVPVMIALLLRRFVAGSGIRRDESAASTDWSRLVVLAISYGGAAGASAALAAFLVESAVVIDISVATAGALLSLGSVASIITRLSVGWLIDRRSWSSLRVVSTMLFVGTVGYCGLAVHQVVVFAVAAAIAFGFGWGWNGAFNHAIVRASPRDPGKATGVAMIGMASGGIVWPLAFGVIASRTTFSTAWLATAALCLASAVLLVLTSRPARRPETDTGTGTGTGTGADESPRTPGAPLNEHLVPRTTE